MFESVSKKTIIVLEAVVLPVMVLFWPADRHDRLDIVALDLHSSPLVLGQCMKSSSPGDNENDNANVGIGDPQLTTTWESLDDGDHCYNDDDDLYST